MFRNLRKIFSFQYNDSPMSDRAYELNTYWIRYLNDYYHRVKHIGTVDLGLKTARKNHVIFICNHAIILEAPLLGYFLFNNGVGKVGTMVFREAFKIPLVREFFRSVQNIPVSVENGAMVLKKRHLLIFPEGMEFIRTFINSDDEPPLHSGFLRMAKKYMESSKRRSISVIPIAHSGLESALKFWVINNHFFLNTLIKPIINFPYLVFPKLPLLLPKKVIFCWGQPVRITLTDLRSKRALQEKTVEFRSILTSLKQQAKQERVKSGFLRLATQRGMDHIAGNKIDTLG